MMKLETAIKRIRRYGIPEEIAIVDNLPNLPVSEVFKLLCFHNLAYCCGQANPCPYRDTVLRTCGISWKEYVETKESAIAQLLLNKGFMQDGN